MALSQSSLICLDYHPTFNVLKKLLSALNTQTVLRESLKPSSGFPQASPQLHSLWFLTPKSDKQWKSLSVVCNFSQTESNCPLGLLPSGYVWLSLALGPPNRRIITPDNPVGVPLLVPKTSRWLLLPIIPISLLSLYFYVHLKAQHSLVVSNSV